MYDLSDFILILSSKFSVVLIAFTCGSAIFNILSICLKINILSALPFGCL